MRRSLTRTLSTVLPVAGLIGLGAAGCDQGMDQVVTPGDPGTTSDQIGQESLALSFTPEGETDTACGIAAGVYVEVSDGAGDVQSCTAMWAPAHVSGEYAQGGEGDHLVADCLFVLDPGIWNVTDAYVVDADEQELACCSADLPEVVAVAEEETNEYGGVLHCDTLGSGGLDIYGVLNRPPSINNVVLTPSKFGQTCQVIEATALASDPEGDDVNYGWAVQDAPTDAVFASESDGNEFWFAGATLGDYEVRLTVWDAYGDSHHLDFPLHLTESGGLCPEPISVIEAYLEAEVDVGDEE